MLTLQEIKNSLKKEKPYLLEVYGVTEVGIFGSYVRHEERLDSDLDILIELERPPRIDLFDLINLQFYLSDPMQVKIDLAIKQNLRRRIGQRILSEVVMV